MPGPLVPDPTQHRYPRAVGGALKAGAPLTNATPVSEDIVLAGAARWRVRGKFTAAGTLAAKYLHPDLQTEYALAANNPADVAVVADTEFVMEQTEHMGEAGLKLTFTPSANGAVTFLHVSEV